MMFWALLGKFLKILLPIAIVLFLYYLLTRKNKEPEEDFDEWEEVNEDNHEHTVN
jgi:hypothetical protein